MFAHHLYHTALILDTDPNTRMPKPRVQKVGLDPHFSYGLMLVCVAWVHSSRDVCFAARCVRC